MPWVGGRTVSSEPSICPELWCQGYTGDQKWGDATKGSGKADGVLPACTLYHQYFSSKITCSQVGAASAMDDMLQETGHAAEVRTKEVSWHSFGTNFLTRVKRNFLVAEAWLPDLSALSSQPPFHLGLKHPPRLSPAHLTGIQARVGFHSSLVARSL